jgi:hypothetical protein
LKQFNNLNIKQKINDFFTYDKYFRMSTEELVEEVRKNHLTVYGKNFSGRREMMLKQLIAKDNATMFKRTLIISFITLIAVIISTIFSIIVIFFK